jgi:hypothetical protein
MSIWSTYNEICTGSGVGDIEPIILTPEEGARHSVVQPLKILTPPPGIFGDVLAMENAKDERKVPDRRM